MYLVLLLAYVIIPPVLLSRCQWLIFQKMDKYGWHLIYLVKYLISLSFLPLLGISQIDLAVVPKSVLSVGFLVLTIILAGLGLKLAIKKQVLHFYLGGVYAAFMEEILFRGIVFGLAKTLWNDNLVALVISSIGFGLWHMKNYAWVKEKKWILKQVLYTGLLYGPLFAGLRILTGDIYLATLWHFITDAYVALAPKKWRWIIIGDKEDKFKD